MENALGTVVFNVGGRKFECLLSTVQEHPCSVLAHVVESRIQYNLSTKEYFFDRNPAIFNSVLEYLRTGELHIPNTVCGLVAKRELEFWGVDEKEIEPCCWKRYNEYQKSVKERNAIAQEFYKRTSDDVWPETALSSRRCCARQRKKLWRVLNEPRSSLCAKIYMVVSNLMVLLSVLSLILWSIPSMREPLGKDLLKNVQNTILELNITSERIILKMTTMPNLAMRILEVLCLTFFVVELILKMVAESNKCRFLRSIYTIIDIFTILPMIASNMIRILYRPVYYEQDLMGIQWFLEVLYLFRIFRLFKLAYYYDGLRVLLLSLKASWRELLLMQIFLSIGIVLFASLVYYAEVQVDGDFTDIFVGFWWAIITMTTVGYGDKHPTTGLGYLVGAFCSLTGVLLIGLPIAVIANNFSKYYDFTKDKSAKDDAKQGTQIHDNVHSPAPCCLPCFGQSKKKNRIELVQTTSGNAKNGMFAVKHSTHVFVERQLENQERNRMESDTIIDIENNI